MHLPSRSGRAGDGRDDVSIKANTTLVREYFEEIWNRFNLDAESNYVASDIVVHEPPIPGLPGGLSGEAAGSR